MSFARGNGLQICVLVVLAAGILNGCGGARARYASHLDRGKEYLAAGNLDKAGVEFRNAAQIQPQNPQALYLSGRVAELRNNIREAAGLYQAAVDSNPNYDSARASLGKLLVFAGAARSALETVAPGIAAHPDNPDFLAVRAAARHQLKDDAAALSDAERAVQLAPSNENAVAILAALYSAALQYPRAIKLVSDAVRMMPGSVDLRETLTNLYLITAQPDKAEEQMRMIVALRPHEMSPRAQLAKHLAHSHRLDAAQSVLEEAVQSFAKYKEQAKVDEARLILVDFIAAQRSRSDGEKTLRGFIAQEPDNLDLRLGLGILLQRTGAAQEAVVAYQEVVRRDAAGAKGLAARDRIAAILIAQNRLDQARELISEVLRNNPRDDDALILRTTIELRDHDPTGAIADLRAVLRDQPNSVPLLRTLARAYDDKGQPALAEEVLRGAMKSAPDDPAVGLELAQLLTQTGRAPQAVALLEELTNRSPDNIQIREALIRAHLAQGNLPAARAAADAAIATVQGAIELNSGDAELLNLLGELYFARKDLTRASETFLRAAELGPREWQPHRNLALVRLAQNDPNGAIGEYESALRVAPAEPRVQIELASLYERQGRSDDAIARYEALYRSDPRMQQFAANNLAMLLVTYKADRASLDRARDLTSGFGSSDNGSLLDTIGWVRFKRGEYRDALPVLERAVSRAPDAKVVRYHLAMTELRLGLRDRARTDLESALTGLADFTGSDEARTALASLTRNGQ